MSQIFSHAGDQPSGTWPEGCLLEFGEFRVDPICHELYRNGELVHLTPTVFDTLWALIENPGQVVTKEAPLHRL